MKQPRLDDRNRDKDGEIRQKRGDTLNKNLPTPVPGFGPNITLARMRKATRQVSEADVSSTVSRRSSVGWSHRLSRREGLATRRIVAIEFSICRSARNGGASWRRHEATA